MGVRRGPRGRRALALAVAAGLLAPAVRVGGQTVQAGKPPSSPPAEGAHRVVSLLPAATELVLALGRSDRLVARTEADRQAELAALPSVGTVLAPNLEVLRAAAPDVVIAWWGADLGPLRRVVEGAGGRVLTPRLDRLADLAPALELLGDVLEAEAAADSLRADLERTIARLRARAEGRARPRVLWVVSADPLVAAGPGTFIDDVLALAGGSNAVAETGTSRPWPGLGLEALVALAPDVLVWPTGPGMFPAAELEERAGWSALAAVRSGRVLVVDGDLYHVPGPGIASAAEALALALERTGER